MWLWLFLSANELYLKVFNNKSDVKTLVFGLIDLIIAVLFFGLQFECIKRRHKQHISIITMEKKYKGKTDMCHV